MPLLAGHRLRLVLTLTTPPLEVALWTSVDWLDLGTLVEHAQATGAEGGMIRTPLGPRTWAALDHGPRVYQLTLGPVRLTLRPEDFAGFGGPPSGGAGTAGAASPSGAARVRLRTYLRTTAGGWTRSLWSLRR